MEADVLAALRAHAAREAPRECCGLIIARAGAHEYRPCRNLAADGNQFALDAADQAAAEDAGEVLAVCHSHPFANPAPSAADRAMCEATGLPWVIVNHPLGTVCEFAPAGYRAPLIGRQFVHGVHDCYSLIRDYYAAEIGIALPDFERADKWWLNGGDLYRAHFAEAGFVEIDAMDLRAHDVILMRIRAAVTNHGAVYLGENRMLQHLMDKLSGRAIYGGWYRRCTTHILRHRQTSSR